MKTHIRSVHPYCRQPYKCANSICTRVTKKNPAAKVGAQSDKQANGQRHNGER
jgi:hypothetical protein